MVKWNAAETFFDLDGQSRKSREKSGRCKGPEAGPDRCVFRKAGEQRESIEPQVLLSKGRQGKGNRRHCTIVGDH